MMERLRGEALEMAGLSLLCGYALDTFDRYGRLSGGDPGGLCRAFLARYAKPAALPDAEAAILAAQEFVPTVADRLLERVRHHYGVPPVSQRPGARPVLSAASLGRPDARPALSTDLWLAAPGRYLQTTRNAVFAGTLFRIRPARIGLLE
jgi:hypothetical protein